MTKGPTRKDSTHPVSAGKVMTASLAHLGIEGKIREYRVAKVWPLAVGEPISRCTRPVRLMGRTLYVEVATPAWMTELRFQQAAILKRLNSMLKEDVVGDIVFRAGEVKPPKSLRKKGPERERPLAPEVRGFIERTVSVIKDESLRETVRRALEKAKTGG